MNEFTQTLQEKVPLWKRIFEQLSNDLSEGVFNGGEHFYSMREICNKYGVSMITAKRVASELESMGLIRGYPGKGTFVFKDSCALKINLLIGPNFMSKDFINFRILRGITEAVQETNSELIPITKPALIKNYKLSSAIIDHEEEQNVIDLGYHIRNSVIIHTSEKRENTSSIGNDYGRGVSLAMNHLFSLGHKRIGFVSGPLTNSWIIPRLEGYLKALRSARVKVDWTILKETDGLKPEEDWTAMRQLLSLKEPPTAIFTSNDSRALHILEYCRNNRIRVPEQLSVVGFDNMPESELSRPALTTIDPDLCKMGKEAVYLLIDLMNCREQQKNILIKPKLVIRETTAPPAYQPL